VQIDCHGQTAALAQSLARAIRAVLRSFPCPGSLPDSDQMFVMNIHALPQQLDGFNEESRTYVRTLEYQVQYLNIE
jgi:protoheme ferro-lyase